MGRCGLRKLAWIAVVGALFLGALTQPITATAATKPGNTKTWKKFIQDREKFLETLAPAFTDCFARRDSAIDPLAPIFHGCIDWHSAVHAAYSHHVLYRRTGDENYLDLVEAQIAPQGVSLIPAEEAYVLAKAPDYLLTENPYGFGWFLVMAQEREESTKKKDFRALADFAADQLVSWFETRATEGDAQEFILNRAHPNYSWSLINLDGWARYTKNKDLLAATKEAVKPLIEKDLDELCPVSMDTSPTAGRIPTGLPPATGRGRTGARPGCAQVGQLTLAQDLLDPAGRRALELPRRRPQLHASLRSVPALRADGQLKVQRQLRRTHSLSRRPA